MKRLTSLDFARGLAIFGMTIFHVFLNDWIFLTTGDFGTITWEYPFAFIFFIFGHWRGFFIMISAVVHMYVMGRSYKSGVEPYKILFKQIVSGLLLFGMGALFNAIFSPWGAMLGLQVNGSWNWETARIFVYFTEALQNISIGIILASVIFFFLTKKDGLQKTMRNIIIFTSLALVIILVSPYVQNGISNFLGYDVNTHDASTATTRHPFVVYLLYQIGGREAPIFPMLASSFFGVAIGIFLIQDKPDKKIFKIGYWFSLGLFLFGLAYLGIVDVAILKKNFFAALVFSHIHPAWFALANSGLEIAAILFLLQKVEFNPKLKTERWLKRSRWFRRWGMISLTIYMLQCMLFPIERLMTWIFGGAIDFNAAATNATFLETLLVATILYLVWEGLIRLWELAKYIGTFEWFLVYLKFPFDQKINHKDPLKIKESLYDVEAITFVEPFEAEATKKAEEMAEV